MAEERKEKKTMKDAGIKWHGMLIENRESELYKAFRFCYHNTRLRFLPEMAGHDSGFFEPSSPVRDISAMTQKEAQEITDDFNDAMNFMLAKAKLKYNVTQDDKEELFCMVHTNFSYNLLFDILEQPDGVGPVKNSFEGWCQSKANANASRMVKAAQGRLGEVGSESRATEFQITPEELRDAVLESGRIVKLNDTVREIAKKDDKKSKTITSYLDKVLGNLETLSENGFKQPKNSKSAMKK